MTRIFCAMALFLVSTNVLAATYTCTVNNSDDMMAGNMNMIEADKVLVPADGGQHFYRTNNANYSVGVIISELLNNFKGYSEALAYFEVDSSTNSITDDLPVLVGTFPTGQKRFQFQSSGKSIRGGGLTGGGNLTNSSSTVATLTIGGDNSSSKIVGGQIGNALPSNGRTINLVKNGSGTLSGGTWFNSGTTTVTNGIFNPSNIIYSAITVTSDSSGAGELLGGLSIPSLTMSSGPNGGGTVRPAASGIPAILTVSGTSDLRGDGNLILRIQGPESYDKLESGPLILDSTSVLTLDLSGIATTGTFKSIISFSTLTGTYSSGNIMLINNPAGFLASLNYNSTSIDLVLTQ